MNKALLNAAELRPLIARAYSIKENLIGSHMGFLDLMEVVMHTEDGCDTDLYCAVLSSEDAKTWVKFYVEVDPNTENIIDIDLSCSDISIDGELYDCIDLGEFSVKVV